VIVQQRREALILLEAALAATIIILVPRLLSFLSIRYYPLLYRIVYYVNYQEPTFGNFMVDDAVLASLSMLVLFLALRLRPFLVLAGVPSALAAGAYLATGDVLVIAVYSIAMAAVSLASIAIIAAYRPLYTRRRQVDKSRVVAIFFFILVAIEAASLARWIAYPVWPDRIYGSPSWFPAKLESSMFHALGSAAVYLSLLLPFAFLLRPFRGYVVSFLRTAWQGTKKVAAAHLDRYARLAEKNSRIILAGVAIFSSLAAAMQFLPSINPTDQPFGVDFYDYSQRIAALAPFSGIELLERVYANNSERPLTILVLAAFQQTFGLQPIVVAKLATVILAPLLVVSAYYFADQTFRNRLLSLLIAFLTATSSYFVIGLYGGFLANWAAIIAMFAFLTVTIRFWNAPTRKSFVAALLLLVTILFLHIYTWTFLILAIGLFLAWTYFYVRKDRLKTKTVFLLALVIGISIAVDLAKTAFGGALGGFEVDRNLVQQSVSGNMFVSRWSNLTFAISTYLGGGLGSILPLLLALVWLVNVKFRDDAGRLVASLFFVAAPMMVFGDYVIQSRLLYILPINVAMSLGAYSIAKSFPDRRISLAFLSFMVLYQLNYVMRSISNFYFVLPQ
jgi:hypothetical protein